MKSQCSFRYSAAPWAFLIFSLCFHACSGGDSSTSKRDSGAPDTGGKTGGAGNDGSTGTATAGTAGSAGKGGSTRAPGSTGNAGSGGMGGSAGGFAGTTDASAAGGTAGSAGRAASNGGTGASAGSAGSAGAGGTGGGGAVSGGAGGTGSGGAGGTGSGGAGGTGSGGAGGSAGPGDYGFRFTVPGSNTVTCTGERGTLTRDAPDADWLCTLHVDSKTAYVYVQSKATSATCILSPIPNYTTVQGQISVDGAVSDLERAQYDGGGNHHNDWLSVDYQGKTYKYYHSSFGFGWRVCQPMDCINVYARGSTTPTIEGCAPTRSLPEVCVPIKADGTHDPLVDTFKKCPGDTN